MCTVPTIILYTRFFQDTEYSEFQVPIYVRLFYME